MWNRLEYHKRIYPESFFSRNINSIFTHNKKYYRFQVIGEETIPYMQLNSRSYS